MKITYIYANLRVDLPASRTPRLPSARAPERLRLPTAVGLLKSQSTEIVGICHQWKKSHKRKSCFNRLTTNTSLFISKNHYFTLFPRLKLFIFFSLLQTMKLTVKGITTPQQPWTNWTAPTMWTLVNAKTDLDELLGPKILSTTWT